MTELDFAALYEDIGSLKAMSRERQDQTRELFQCVRDIAAKMATKDDVKAIAERLQKHVNGEDCASLHQKVEEMDAERKLVKGAAMIGIAAPPFLAALIEVTRWVIGKH